MQRLFVIFGMILMLIGILWPYIIKIKLGRLPGDIYFNIENLRFYLPITTTIIISIIISLVLWIIQK